MSTTLQRYSKKCLLFFLGLVIGYFDFLGKIIFKSINYFYQKKTLPEIKNPILLLSASEILDGFKNRKFTCSEVVNVYIERQNLVQPILNAIVFNRYNEAREEALKVDKEIASHSTNANELADLWKEKPLLGLPVTIKEAFSMKGCPNCAGLVSRQHYRCDEDATMVQRLKLAGAIPLCETNIPELCMWWESYNNVYGRTNNPYDSRRTVGGSSGGEGALIGAAASVCGIGSDIGGSIRMPAHFNGIYGHKPTTGTLENDGQFPEAHDKELEYLLPGPMCRYANDLRIMMKSLARPDVAMKLRLNEKITDITQVEFFYMEDIGDRVFSTKLQEEIRTRMQKVVQNLRDLGCRVEKVTRLKRTRNAYVYWDAKMSISDSVPTAVTLADGRPEGFQIGKEIWKWITRRSPHTLPALILVLIESLSNGQSEETKQLCDDCDILREEISHLLSYTSYKDKSGRVLQKYRVLLLPAHPTTAPFHYQPFFRSFNFSYAGLFNVLGLPATAVPIGFDRQGLPFDFQIVGNMHEDFVTLSVAEMFENQFGGWVKPN